MCYVTLPDDANVLSCIVSTGHFCRLKYSHLSITILGIMIYQQL